MNTLIDFVRFTKGWEYVIAISAVFTFVAFWALWRSATEHPAPSERPATAGREKGSDVKGLRTGHARR